MTIFNRHAQRSHMKFFVAGIKLELGLKPAPFADRGICRVWRSARKLSANVGALCGYDNSARYSTAAVRHRFPCHCDHAAFRAESTSIGGEVPVTLH